MADEQTIRVVITGVASDLRRALDGAKGDLGGLKAAIKDVPNTIKVDVQAEVDGAKLRLQALKDAANDVPKHLRINVDADTGVASAKLRLLKSQISDTESSLARVALGMASPGGGGGGGGSGAAGVASSGAGFSPGLAGALVAGAPIIAGLAGSLTAIVGSAGAAALGLGAVGTAAAGAGAAGLGPLLLLSGGLKDATALAAKLETQQKSLTGAIAVFGAGSTQALAAQDALNKTMAGADPAVLKFALSWGKLTDALDNASQSVLPAFTTALAPILDTFTKLLPTIEQMARIDLRGVSAFVKPLLDFANSQAFRTAMLNLSRTFAQLGGPLGQAFTNLMRAFLNVAIAASPFLIRIADAFASWTKSFADALTPGKHLNDLIGGLVGQLKSWWDLAKSLGGVMVSIFSAGATAGQGLVDKLTGILKQWNAWLNTKAGQDAMKTFFRDSAALVTAVVTALAPLIGAISVLVVKMMPTFTAVITALTPALHGLATIVGIVGDALSSKLVQDIAVTMIKFNPLVQLLGHLPQVFGWVKTAVGDLGDFWKGVWDGIVSGFKIALDFILGGISSLLGAIKSVVDTANISLPIVGHLFGSLGTGVSKNLGTAQASIDNFRKTLQPTQNTVATTVGGIGNSYETLAKLVPGYMSQVVSATTKGLSDVDKLLVNALDKLGIKPTHAVIAGLTTFPGQPGSFPTLGKAPGDLPKHAGGGLVQVGRPGERGHDTIGMNVGGTDIKVGAGEKVAVFNNEQQAVADHFMAPVGGLGGMFSRFKRPHYMAGGGMVPGFSGGGTIPYAGLEGLWDRAGGAPSMAALMAAIAEAESGGNPSIVNSIGASGLWQIHPAEAGDLDPLTNARIAVRKLASQGLGAWEAYTNGSYKQFLHGAVPPNLSGVGSAIAATFQALSAPKWTGPGGAAGAIGQGAVSNVTAAANKFISSQASAQAPVGAGAPFIPGGGATSGPGGLASFEGVTMAKWIANELGWATQHGWHGQPTSGYRPGFDPHAPSGSEHALINYPGGAVDFGGFTDPAAYATKLALVQLAARLNYPGPRLLMPIGFHDDGHLSGTGHAGGGFIDQVKTLPAGGGSWVDRMTIGSIDSAGNSGGFNQAGKHYALGTVPRGPVAGPWWAEGDRRATIGTSFGGKPGGQAARFTKGAKSTVAFKVDTGDGNSFGDIYPTANSAIDFTDNGPVKVDFISDADARALLSGPGGSKAKAPSSLVDYSHGRRPGGSLSFAKPKHPFKLPKFKALPGFDPKDLNQIAGIENYLSGSLTPWQGLVTGEHGRQPVVPLVTLADGSQVVNKDGMIDPVTGQFAKGTNARLAEIGHLGGTPDLNTELGIDQKYLDEYMLEAIAAGRASKQFLPWLAKMKGDRAKQTGAASDDQAVIDRLTLLRSRLPKERSDRTFAISQRFKLARHQLQTSSSTGKFNASQLLTAQLTGLSQEEVLAKGAVGTKAPAGWKGTAPGWAAQRKSEVAGLTAEFAGRRQALQASATEHKFAGLLAKSNALFGLGQEEAAEKHSLSDSFTQRSLDFGTQIKSSTAWLGRDKRLLASDESALTAATGTKDGSRVIPGGGSFADQLASMLGPMGTLALNIAQKNKIDIPNLTDEIAALTGTKPAAATTTSADLTAQLLAETQQALATSRAQFGVFSGFEPLLAGRLMGSFATGIDRVPQTGPYLLHRDEMVVPDPYGPQSNRASVQTSQGPVEIVVVMGNNDVPLMKVIEATMNQKALRIVSDHSGQTSRLLSGVRRP